MKTGIVFDIKEFSVHDGPGIRTTVFLKGCPLRCQWCHNPEGLSPYPEVMVSAACVHCGKCSIKECSITGEKSCIACGNCLSKCPYGYRRIVGQEYTSEQLIDTIMKNSIFLANGGVTFSGGEPLLQSEFLEEVLQGLPLHKAIQTCGYCDTDSFKSIIGKFDYVFFDIKHTDSQKHKYYTGVDNTIILKNLDYLKNTDIPFVVRVPLLVGVNDDEKNLIELAELLKETKNLLRVEVLPYNEVAPAKYPLVCRNFDYKFTSPGKIDSAMFLKYGISVSFL